MNKNIINTPSAPKAIGPYSQAVLADGWLYVSGQIPLDPVSNNIVSDDIKQQTRQVLDNIKAIVASAGGTLDNIVKTTVYMQDLSEFPLMNEVYQQYFTTNPPARATVEVAKLPKNVKIEIDAVARIK